MLVPGIADRPVLGDPVKGLVTHRLRTAELYRTALEVASLFLRLTST